MSEEGGGGRGTGRVSLQLNKAPPKAMEVACTRLHASSNEAATLRWQSRAGMHTVIVVKPQTAMLVCGYQWRSAHAWSSG